MDSRAKVEFLRNETRRRVGWRWFKKKKLKWLGYRLRTVVKKWNSNSAHNGLPKITRIVVTCHTEFDKIEISVEFRDSYSVFWETGYNYTRFLNEQIAEATIRNNILQAWKDLQTNIASTKGVQINLPMAADCA